MQFTKVFSLESFPLYGTKLSLFSIPNVKVSVYLSYLLYPFGKLLESIRPLGEPSGHIEPFHFQLVEEDEAGDGAELGRLREVVL